MCPLPYGLGTILVFQMVLLAFPLRGACFARAVPGALGMPGRGPVLLISLVLPICQITAELNHSKRFPGRLLRLPINLNLCHGNMKVLKVVISQENRYCDVRS